VKVRADDLRAALRDRREDVGVWMPVPVAGADADERDGCARGDEELVDAGARTVVRHRHRTGA
jgi:hypothetical protein